MKVSVSKAEGEVLDWMVGTALGGEYHGSAGDSFWLWRTDPIRYSNSAPSYSSDWQQVGPILSRERISRTINHSGLWIAYWTDGYTDGDEGKFWMQCDQSELVAGLRCFVAMKLGPEVDIPDEFLLKQHQICSRSVERQRG